MVRPETATAPPLDATRVALTRNMEWRLAASLLLFAARKGGPCRRATVGTGATVTRALKPPPMTATATEVAALLPLKAHVSAMLSAVETRALALAGSDRAAAALVGLWATRKVHGGAGTACVATRGRRMCLLAARSCWEGCWPLVTSAAAGCMPLQVWPASDIDVRPASCCCWRRTDLGTVVAGLGRGRRARPVMSRASCARCQVTASEADERLGLAGAACWPPPSISSGGAPCMGADTAAEAAAAGADPQPLRSALQRPWGAPLGSSSALLASSQKKKRQSLRVSVLDLSKK
jgi:hypothetical protein